MATLVSIGLTYSLTAASFSFADVVVFSNRSGDQVSVTVAPLATGVATEYTLADRQTLPAPTIGPAQVAFQSGGERKRYRLDANCCYFFHRARGRLDLSKIELGGDEDSARGTNLAKAVNQDSVVTLPVVLLTDEEEQATRRLWEERLRKRLEKASNILEQFTRVRLRVVGVETWDSDDSLTEFSDSLTEFESEVDPGPGRLAIGFTSQYTIPKGRTHLGGTRGPLQSHILLREWSQHVSEVERMELLLHEVGHHLGAAHSKDSDSVMRPILGDRQARLKDFRIQFDPVNALAIHLVAEELRFRRARDFGAMTTPTRDRLRDVYGALARANPDDPSAQSLLKAIDRAEVSPLVLGTRRVVQTVQRAGASNARLPFAASGGNGPHRYVGDRLTEYYVRQAAHAASQLSPEVAPQAFLCGIGIALDDSDLLLKQPKLGGFIRAVESPAERQRRLEVLGKPTMRERRDLAQHFAVSALLTAVLGSKAADAIGMTKEVGDASDKSGFSFSDLAANRAGIFFAGGVLKGLLPLKQIAEGYSPDSYLPAVDGLPDELSHSEFQSRFGAIDDERFLKLSTTINKRIVALPAYQRMLEQASNRE